MDALSGSLLIAGHRYEPPRDDQPALNRTETPIQVQTEDQETEFEYFVSIIKPNSKEIISHIERFRQVNEKEKIQILFHLASADPDLVIESLEHFGIEEPINKLKLILKILQDARKIDFSKLHKYINYDTDTESLKIPYKYIPDVLYDTALVQTIYLWLPYINEALLSRVVPILSTIELVEFLYHQPIDVQYRYTKHLSEAKRDKFNHYFQIVYATIIPMKELDDLGLADKIRNLKKEDLITVLSLTLVTDVQLANRLLEKLRSEIQETLSDLSNVSLTRRKQLLEFLSPELIRRTSKELNLCLKTGDLDKMSHLQLAVSIANMSEWSFVHFFINALKANMTPFHWLHFATEVQKTVLLRKISDIDVRHAAEIIPRIFPTEFSSTPQLIQVCTQTPLPYLKLISRSQKEMLLKAMKKMWYLSFYPICEERFKQRLLSSNEYKAFFQAYHQQEYKEDLTDKFDQLVDHIIYLKTELQVHEFRLKVGLSPQMINLLWIIRLKL